METEEVKELTGLNLYQGVRGVAVKLLNRVDRTDAYLDKLLDIEIKNSELTSSEKALLFEIVHGVVRWLGRIDWILNGFYKGQFSKCIPSVKNGMRVALYQILFIDKIQDSEAINEAVEFVKKLQGQKPSELTNTVLRSISRNKDGIRYPKQDEDIVAYYSAYYSHPSWLVKRWINRFGEKETEKLLLANGNKPSQTLHVNALKTTPDEFKKLLHEVDLKYSEGRYLNDFFKLANLTNITAWKYFSQGYFSVQDESTGLAVKLLTPKPDMKVLDFCSTPEGRAPDIAALMNNEGQLICLDKFESRVKIQKRNFDRLGVKNVKIEIQDVDEYEGEGFDRVFINAPSTGFGTLTKKPDLKWKRDLGDIRKIVNIQFELLKKGAKFLKPGGALVYSTDSTEPEENFEIVNKFISENQNYKLIDAAEELPKELLDSNGCMQTFTHIHGIDGSFAAKILREN